MALVTQPQIKEMTPHSYTSSANLVGSYSRKMIDIPPNILEALRILYKNMTKKPSGYTVLAMVDPFVGGLEHHDLFVGQEDVYQLSHIQDLGITEIHVILSKGLVDV